MALIDTDGLSKAILQVRTNGCFLFLPGTGKGCQGCAEEEDTEDQCTADIEAGIGGVGDDEGRHQATDHGT